MGNNKMKIFRRLCVVVCLLNTYGITVSAQSEVNKPFLQEGKEWYIWGTERSVYESVG